MQVHPFSAPAPEANNWEHSKTIILVVIKIGRPSVILLWINVLILSPAAAFLVLYNQKLMAFLHTPP
jgi:hypothetical protein